MTTNAQVINLIMELRRGGISDRRVLGVIETLPRELFMAAPFRDRAYENAALPIAHGQTISQPYTVAYMTQALEVGPRMKVLEIGTGSGYQAAVLSRLCRRVYTIERYRTLLEEAERRFAALDLPNITSRHGDGHKGWPEQAPFERILMTAAAAEIPPKLVDQLGPGGILVAPVGAEDGEQVIIRLRKSESGTVREDMISTRFVPLVQGVAREA